MTRSQRWYLRHVVTIATGFLLSALADFNTPRWWVGLALVGFGLFGCYMAERRITLEGERP